MVRPFVGEIVEIGSFHGAAYKALPEAQKAALAAHTAACQRLTYIVKECIDVNRETEEDRLYRELLKNQIRISQINIEREENKQRQEKLALEALLHQTFEATGQEIPKKPLKTAKSHGKVSL